MTSLLTSLATFATIEPLGPQTYRFMNGLALDGLFSHLVPEAILLLTALAMLLLDVNKRTSAPRGGVHILALTGIGAAFIACVTQELGRVSGVFFDWGYLPGVLQPQPKGALLASDGLSHAFRFYMLIAGACAVGMFASAREMKGRKLGELYALLLASLAGMMLLCSANNALMAYLAIEMMSLPSYVLIALRRKHREGGEAGLKFMLFGAVASGVMVYGLSLLYGMSGSLAFETIGHALANADSTNVYGLGFALVLVLAGLGYKMAVAPMHFWAADAYEGGPTPVAGFMSVASKAAGFAVALRFVFFAASPEQPGTGVLPIVELLALLGVFSMTVGNLAALRQTHLRRVLAYSSVSHGGIMLVGVAALAWARQVHDVDMAAAALSATVLYLYAYMLATVCAFSSVLALENEGHAVEVWEFRGLSRRNPLLALCFMVALLSLLGVPPAAGFFAKFVMFRTAMDAAFSSTPMAVLLIGALANTALSAAYYFKIAREMFLTDAVRGTYRPFALGRTSKVVTGGTALATVVLFVALGLVETPLNKLLHGPKGEPAVLDTVLDTSRRVVPPAPVDLMPEGAR